MIRKRKGTGDDPGIYKLIQRELLPQTRRAMPNMKFDRKTILQRIQEGTTFVAEHKGYRAPVGFITWAIKDQILYIDMLAIQENMQGKGIGTSLMNEAEKHGLQKGCTTAMLYVSQWNEHARNFYAAKGYQAVRLVHELNCYLFIKTLHRHQNGMVNSKAISARSSANAAPKA